MNFAIKITSYLFLSITAGLLVGCQHPYSTAYFGIEPQRTIAHLPLAGGQPSILLSNVVSEALSLDHNAQVIYSAWEPSVGRWTLTGKALESLPLPKGMRTMTLDAKGGHLYLAEELASHDIVRTDLKGQNLTVIVRDARYCQALAFDGKRRTLYWSRAYPSSIWRANADGSGARPVASETLVPTAIAVDESGKRLFWACTDFEGNTAHITRANLDGTGPVKVLANRPAYIQALAVDSAARRIYWAERPTGGGSGFIRSARFDGSQVRTVLALNSEDYASSLALGWLPGEKR